MVDRRGTRPAAPRRIRRGTRIVRSAYAVFTGAPPGRQRQRTPRPSTAPPLHQGVPQRARGPCRHHDALSASLVADFMSRARNGSEHVGQLCRRAGLSSSVNGGTIPRRLLAAKARHDASAPRRGHSRYRARQQRRQRRSVASACGQVSRSTIAATSCSGPWGRRAALIEQRRPGYATATNPDGASRQGQHPIRRITSTRL